MPQSSKIYSDMSAGKYDVTLSKLYGKEPEVIKSNRDRYLRIIKKYGASYGSVEGITLFSSPGRIEIGGNHTDHQRGCALAGAISLDIAAAAAPNNTNKAVLVSEGYRKVSMNLTDTRPKKHERGLSAALIRGIVARLSAMGYKTGGFNLYTHTRLPNGAGMSSSAAFENLVGTIINQLFNKGAIPPHKLALAGQYAENIYFGKPCGLLDQMASALGGLIYVDFINPKNPLVERVENRLSSSGYTIFIVNTGKSHSGMSSVYASVSNDMSSVASAMGRSVLRNVDEAAFWRAIPKLRYKVGDRALLRAIHFFAENKRPAAEAAALRTDDMDTFLKLVSESGRSSFMYNQNIYADPKSQSLSIALAQCDNLLKGRGAFRVHGGGFEGTVEAFVPNDMIDNFESQMERCFGPGCCYSLGIRAAGSTRL